MAMKNTGRVVNASNGLYASEGECIFIAYFQAANEFETLSILLCCNSKFHLEFHFFFISLISVQL